MSEQDSKIKILFVCEGNTCRSPMAQAIFSKIVFDRYGAGASKFEIESAGLNASGTSPTKEAIEAMHGFGVDISGFKVKNINADLVNKADMILTMTLEQKDRLDELFPDAQDKIEMLGAYVEDMENAVVPGRHFMSKTDYEERLSHISVKEINDPFGQGIEEYELCAFQLEQILIKLLDKIGNAI